MNEHVTSQWMRQREARARKQPMWEARARPRVKGKFNVWCLMVIKPTKGVQSMQQIIKMRWDGRQLASLRKTDSKATGMTSSVNLFGKLDVSLFHLPLLAFLARCPFPLSTLNGFCDLKLLKFMCTVPLNVQWNVSHYCAVYYREAFAVLMISSLEWNSSFWLKILFSLVGEDNAMQVWL